MRGNINNNLKETIQHKHCCQFLQSAQYDFSKMDEVH